MDRSSWSYGNISFSITFSCVDMNSLMYSQSECVDWDNCFWRSCPNSCGATMPRILDIHIGSIVRCFMDTMSLLLKKELFLQDESDQLWGHKARNIGHGVRDTEHYP